MLKAEPFHQLGRNFKFSITLSDPMLVNRLSLLEPERFSNKYADAIDRELLIRGSSSMAGYMEASLNMTSNRYTLSNPNPATNLKLQVPFRLVLKLWLESYLAWDVPGTFSTSTSQEVKLEWPDIELNPVMRWRLPFKRLETKPHFFGLITPRKGLSVADLGTMDAQQGSLQSLQNVGKGAAAKLKQKLLKK